MHSCNEYFNDFLKIKTIDCDFEKAAPANFIILANLIKIKSKG